MKKKFRIIVLILLATLTIYWLWKYWYYKYMSSLNFHIEEKLVVQFYKDDNIYLIDLNNYKWDKLYWNSK